MNPKILTIGILWIVLELDQNPERQKIYPVPGFYDNALYRIYPDRSEKIKRIK
jgi:hypothetical protein